MELCTECMNESVVERSSYTICHSCGNVVKAEWRLQIENDLDVKLHGHVRFVAGRKLDDKYVVVQWARTTEEETGTHIYNSEAGAFFSGAYFYGEMREEEAAESYLHRARLDMAGIDLP